MHVSEHQRNSGPRLSIYAESLSGALPAVQECPTRQRQPGTCLPPGLLSESHSILYVAQHNIYFFLLVYFIGGPWTFAFLLSHPLHKHFPFCIFLCKG